MATRHYWLAVAVCESKVVSQPPQVSPRRYPTLRSLRLRHPTRCLAGSVAAPPSVRCASLSTCSTPLTGTTSARPMRLLPLHPPHLAARSMLGGRSSPEPAKPSVPSPPCQGLRHRAIAFCIPSEGTRSKELSPVSRETLHTASINFGNPISLLRHAYYVKWDVLDRFSRQASLYGDGSAQAR